MLTNMSEIMSKKISVLDISIDNFTAKRSYAGSACLYGIGSGECNRTCDDRKSYGNWEQRLRLKKRIENFDLITGW